MHKILRPLLGVLLCAAFFAERGSAQTASASGRELVLCVKSEGFGGASTPDIQAVLRSAGGEIWRHCPHTRFPPQGFEIYHSATYPITQYELSSNGCIVIGLAVEGRLWARFSFQFAHEFAHALMDHSNDPGRPWHKLEHANQWLEESICETASLFSLRAMAQTWPTQPPYPNWKSYAPALADYAAQRMAEPRHRLPAGQTFAAWFAAEEPGLRLQWAQREKNTLIAQQLLPLFEAEPAGWEAVTSLKLGTRDVSKTLTKHLAEWHANAPAAQRAFIIKISAVFGVTIQPLPKGNP
jgi:hypothetical protein